MATDVSEVMKSFGQPTPRRVCLKRDQRMSLLGCMGEFLGCSGMICAVILIAGLAFMFMDAGLGLTIVRNGAIFAAIILGITTPYLIFCVTSFHHRRLARFGTASLGKILSYNSVLELDDTPAPPNRTTIEYEYVTTDGERLTGKRDTISGEYTGLRQGGDVVIFYLPKRPGVHEPYESLVFEVCD